MNSLQSLCVTCSRLSECALELECLRFCDPITLIDNMSNFKKNGVIIIHLFKTLYEDLQKQNLHHASPLTVYMQILLKAMYKQVLLLDASLHNFVLDNNKQKYFENVFQLNECQLHLNLKIQLSNGLMLSVDLSTINDIEKLLCKINSIYGLILPEHGIGVCNKIIDFLEEICGVCVILKPETFVETITCLKCYEELSLLPNQGKSIRKRLAGKFCNHISETEIISNIEKNFSMIEKDLELPIKNFGSVNDCLSKISNIFQQSHSGPIHLNEAEQTLSDYDIFSEIPDVIYSLSEFTYWSKISESIIKRASITLHQLNLCHTFYTDLQNELSKYLYGETIEDVFSLNEDNITNDEKLYVGSRFISPCRVIDIVTNLSIKNLQDNPFFIKLNEEDEIQNKIKDILSELEKPISDQPKKYVTHTVSKEHDIQQEIHIRKKNYYQKVSESGYNKVMTCIKEQESLINKLMNVNILGSYIFEAISLIMNGFSIRQMNSMNMLNDPCTYDDHLYIKNNLLSKKLPKEILPELSQKMYCLLAGPLTDYHSSSFPLACNISMAYACDVADFLPHIKDELAKYVEGAIHPETWMLCEYNGFFNFNGSTNVNEMQKKLWGFVRELVLSVALYNDVFGKQLLIRKSGEKTDLTDQIIFTLNTNSPLLIKRGGNILKFNDLYSLLYYDLKTQPVTLTVPNKPIKRLTEPNLLDLSREDENNIPKCFFN
ncbi:DNA packaging terminase subunit 2 [macacine betaherpesvirus 9]|uniref:DNA packaging terminase subunit 2 n=1 Tax=macacine betaherpesvirus 9 TaxID=2560568 RepID=A0A192XNP6_9BETA|nr:DNA packaging terminase subunit 2 [macacine betaherpesvirus 9]ANC96531.1 DNA packaging terminase subunit 2 [macacine betaherpesvirus 9]